MKNLFPVLSLTIVALTYAAGVSAQGLPCPPNTNAVVNAGPDVTVCPNQCTTLQAAGNATLQPTTVTYNVDSTPYTAYPYNTGTTYNVVTDDTYGPLLQLPFAFCFFGNKYTQCVIGSNGQITFNAAAANAGSGWVITTPIPTNNVAYNNAIMAPTHDLYIPDGGSVKYATYGVAPCRVFVVSWDSVAYFTNAGCPGNRAIQQIVLHESTYQIDINIHRKDACPSWNNGLAIIGIQNANATAAYSLPGKNATVWTATDKSYRFTPSGPTGVVTGSGYTWYNINGTQLGTGTSIQVCPSVTTDYVLKGEFYSGCDTIRKNDTVRVIVDNGVVADFNYTINYGCDGDTVHFTDNSTGGFTYKWDFGDGNGDTAKNPTHIYNSQNIFNVTLIATASNTFCKDTVTKPVDLVHPLDASFTVDDDSVCQYSLVNFTNTSITTTRNGIDPTYFWEFGDGGTSTLESPSHTYNSPGVYVVKMTVKDFVPCYDTATHIIVVDSIPYVSFMVSDSILCEGSGITFTGDYLDIGNTGIRWDFGDGTTINDRNPILHAFDSSGTITITLTAMYRICDDVSFTKDITLKPYPKIDLGPDTVMCPNGDPITLSDQLATGNPAITYKWNTGETGPSITVRHNGVYSATKTDDGCSASDDIEVFKNCYIDIPNSFTPNGDGVNDYFLPRQLLSRGVTSFKMSVYSRWGQVLFETTNINGRGWDGNFNGKGQPQGVYVYLIEATFLNGGTEKYQGNVTLLR